MGICNSTVFGGGPIQYPLTIKHSGRQGNTVTGLLIPGTDPSAWLQCAAEAHSATASLSFLPVHETRTPGQSAAPTLVGALCVRDSGAFSPDALAQTGVVLYRTRANRLFLPIDADIEPAISDSDLLLLLATDRHYVWHPSIGLVGYEPQQVLTVQDLLSTPAAQSTDWDTAEIGECLNSTIHNLLPQPAPDAGDILDRGQDDIGSETGNLKDAPRSPDEQSGAAIRDVVKGASDAANAALAGLVHGITSRLPTSGRGSDALGRLHAWAESILNNRNAGGQEGAEDWTPPDQQITTKRENELKRLMNLLQNDPDQGLKYALPMGGEDRSRGMGRAGDRLLENDANFDLSQLGRSGRADVWDMPWEYQVRLIETYRDLAQREQRLGRYRRAAYIYGTLLNDLPAAAATLEAGGLFHDAAAVYIEHLQDPTKAAACLRRGGFWEEAAQIYINRERWLDAAEMYVEIDRPADAREMFQKAIQECRQRSDYVTAGELADQRLDDPELATTILFTGWMQAADGQACFRQLMNLNGRRGHHQDAQWVMRQLTAEDELNRSQMEAATEACSEFATSYPDESVRTAARQHTIRLAARLLHPGDADQPASHAIAMSAVRALAQTDRLLQSDTYRFEQQCNAAEEAEPKPVATRRLPQIKSAKHITTLTMEPDDTPAGTRWINVVSNGREIFRCGVTDSDRIVLVRQQLASAHGARLLSNDDIFVLPTPVDFDPASLQLRLSADQSCVYPIFIPGEARWCDSNENQRVLQGTDGWVQFLTASVGEIWDARPTATGGMICLNVLPGETEWDIQLSAQDTNGLPAQTIRLASIWDKAGPAHQPLFLGLHLAKHAYLIIGRTLLKTKLTLADLNQSKLRSAATIVIEEFPDKPTRLIAAPKHTVPRIVLSFAEGARAIWTEQSQSCQLAVDMIDPITAFTKNGILAVTCRQSGRIEFYRLKDGSADLICESRDHGPVLHLACGMVPNEIMVFRDRGLVTRLEVPVR